VIDESHTIRRRSFERATSTNAVHTTKIPPP
jgi:hypothetical protein